MNVLLYCSFRPVLSLQHCGIMMQTYFKQRFKIACTVGLGALQRMNSSLVVIALYTLCLWHTSAVWSPHSTDPPNYTGGMTHQRYSLLFLDPFKESLLQEMLTLCREGTPMGATVISRLGRTATIHSTIRIDAICERHLETVFICGSCTLKDTGAHLFKKKLYADVGECLWSFWRCQC